MAVFVVYIYMVGGLYFYSKNIIMKDLVNLQLSMALYRIRF